MQEKAKITLIDQMALENLRMCSARKGKRGEEEHLTQDK